MYSRWRERDLRETGTRKNEPESALESPLGGQGTSDLTVSGRMRIRLSPPRNRERAVSNYSVELEVSLFFAVLVLVRTSELLGRLGPPRASDE